MAVELDGVFFRAIFEGVTLVVIGLDRSFLIDDVLIIDLFGPSPELPSISPFFEGVLLFVLRSDRSILIDEAVLTAIVKPFDAEGGRTLDGLDSVGEIAALPEVGPEMTMFELDGFETGA